MTTKLETEKAEAVKDLLAMPIKPGQRIYSIVRSVAKSGMSRRIDFYTIIPDGNGGSRMAWLSGLMAKLGIGSRSQDKPGLLVGGCGMDMCFACVYELGQTLWPKGTRKPHGTRNGEPDSEGGYALKSECL